MPLPRTVQNPYTEKDRQEALRILAKCDQLEPVCESLGNIGVANGDLLQQCGGIRETVLAFLSEFFPE